MIVWGGAQFVGGTTPFQTGGIYESATDSWTETSIFNAPTPRYQHVSVWTGKAMLVWGGTGDTGQVNTGGSSR